VIIVCCVCQKVIGEKEPLDDKTETHTYCRPCYQIHFPECVLCGDPTDGHALCPDCDAETT